MKTRFHLFLHVGCVALLLVQGLRIQQLRNEKVANLARERKVREILWLVIHTPNPPGLPDPLVGYVVLRDPRCALGNPADPRCLPPTYVDYKEAIEPPMNPYPPTGNIY
jgi:hypothetical protein